MTNAVHTNVSWGQAQGPLNSKYAPAD